MRYLVFLGIVAFIASCRTAGPADSESLNVPQVGNQQVAQGGTVVVNHCAGGEEEGHEGNRSFGASDRGWRFNEAEGCFQDCGSIAAMEADFVRQLRSHRVYGNPDVLRQLDPAAADMQARFQQAIRDKNNGVPPHSFADITTDQVFDGSKWTEWEDKPQVGDLFINLNFGQPNHAGIFYSKRGLAHARLVVDVQDDHIMILDSGWEALSRVTEINAQSVWLRPRAAYFDDEDRERVRRWSQVLAPVPYDNTLYDDWAQFRNTLHTLIDGGTPEEQAVEQVFAMSQEQGFAPGGLAASFEFAPPSGMYCSEGPAAIFMYSGFRQFGETALDILRLFGDSDSLPEWSIYADALSGFGADSEESIYMMHKIFFSYFEAFDRARKLGLIDIPGTSAAELQAMSPVDALEANFKALGPHFMAGMQDPEAERIDPVRAQFAAARTAISRLRGEQRRQAEQDVAALEAGLGQAAAALGERAGRDFTVGDAIYLTFYANKSYGPHTFFENSKYFDFKGVTYNSNLRGGYQALYIADWWLDNFEVGRQQANISTTLYRLAQDDNLPEDRCVIREKAPFMPNRY